VELKSISQIWIETNKAIRPEPPILKTNLSSRFSKSMFWHKVSELTE
jgi:hypothetical protein